MVHPLWHRLSLFLFCIHLYRWCSRYHVKGCHYAIDDCVSNKNASYCQAGDNNYSVTQAPNITQWIINDVLYLIIHAHIRHVNIWNSLQSHYLLPSNNKQVGLNRFHNGVSSPNNKSFCNLRTVFAEQKWVFSDCIAQDQRNWFFFLQNNQWIQRIYKHSIGANLEQLIHHPYNRWQYWFIQVACPEYKGCHVI